MAENTKLQGTNIASRIVPFDSQDTFPTHEAFYGRGGYRTVEDIASRDAIPEQRLEEGMLVYCKNDPTGVHTYRYMGMKEGTSIRIWKELKLEGTGVPIYTNANVEEMRDAGVNVDEMDYITIPDDDDIEGEVTNKTYETTQNGTYVDILFKAIRALQSEVARLKNSFLYGIESYSGKNTAMSAISADLEEAIEEEPLWAVEEDGLSSVYDLFESDSTTIVNEFNREFGDVEVTENPSNNQYYITVNGRYVTWDAVENSDLGEITDSKLFLYFVTTGEGDTKLKFNLHIQEDYENGTSRIIDYNLSDLLKNKKTRSNVYNTLVVISRAKKIAVSAPSTEEDSETGEEVTVEHTEYLGYNYVWISVSDPETNNTLLEGYLKDGNIYNIRRIEDNSDDSSDDEDDPNNSTWGGYNVNSIDALIDPGSSITDETNRVIIYDGRLSLRSIDFLGTTVITKFHAYSKYQDFSKEVIPSKPTDEDYKFKAAHITIRSVDTYETLKEIKDRLLNNELILVEDKYKLYIKINDTLVAIGSSQSDGSESPGDGSDDNTGMTKEEIINWLKDNGIVVTENGGDLVLNDVADITFKHEATGKTFKFTVNERGGLDSQEVPTKSIQEELNDDKYALIENNFRGFIAQYRLRDKVNQLGNAKIKSDRLKIGSFYAPLSGDIVHGCTHSFIELENTSDIPISLKGIYLHVTMPVRVADSIVQKIYSLELTGTIPSGGTYLIRGARHAEDEDANAYIKVKTYDQEWYVNDEGQGSSTSASKKLLSLEIIEDVDYEHSNYNFGYGMCLTYGNSDFNGVESVLTPRTPLVQAATKGQTYHGIQITDDNKDTLKYLYHKCFIDGLCYYFGLQTEGKAHFWAGNTIGGVGKTMSNVMYRNMFELDPASQAYQALQGSDSSRIRWAKNNNDVQLLKLDKEFISFPNSRDIYPISKFTPKASWEHRNVCTDKSKLDPNKPNMVTCSFGINIYTTRCFNWISLGYFDEYVWIKKTEENGQSISNSSWTKIESYKTINSVLTENSSYPHRKEFSGTNGVNINNVIYARITGRFPADNSFYTAHKVIVNVTENPVSTKTVYTYVVGRADKNGNPDPEHTSREQTFTLYPTSYTTKIYQITDQQGFHWIEYQAWAAAADKLNEIIEDEVNSSNIIPILINTGDMTQNGTRINEWYDYYQAGRNLFDHLEQMNCVGNNDLCNTDINALGTGDDEGKSNSYYFHVFYCYEIDDNVFTPICSGLNNTKTPKYIPSLYYFDSTTDRFLVVNSEITAVNSKRWFELVPTDDTKNEKYINIYTGWSFNTSDSTEQVWYGDRFEPIYNKIYSILSNASDLQKKVIAVCHEMPFTVITHASLVASTPSTTGTSNENTDRSISSSKLIGSHLNQIHAKEFNEVEYRHTMKGTYWFSRLIEYFNVKLVIGGHKHTYACTYPIRENYNYVKNGAVVNSLEGGKMEMESNLYNDSINVFNNDYSKNLTKFPYIKKDDLRSPTASTSYFFPSIDIAAYIVDNNVNSSSDFSTNNIYQLGTGGGNFVVAESFESGTTYYKKNPDCANFGGVVYFMCQATGYKLKSNKELPSTYQTFSKIIPKTNNTSETPDAAQQYPMFAKISVQNGNYNITLCRLHNILDDSAHTLTQTKYGTGEITVQYLITDNSNSERYGTWLTKTQAETDHKSLFLFTESYFTD